MALERAEEILDHRSGDEHAFLFRWIQSIERQVDTEKIEKRVDAAMTPHEKDICKLTPDLQEAVKEASRAAIKERFLKS